MFKGLCNFATVKITEKIKSWLSKSNNLWSNLMFLKGNSTGKRLSKGWKRKQKLKHPIVYSFFSLRAPVKRNKLYSCTPQGKGKSLLIVLQGKGRSLLIYREREVIFKLLKLLLWPIFFPFPLHLWQKFFLSPYIYDQSSSFSLQNHE